MVATLYFLLVFSTKTKISTVVGYHALLAPLLFGITLKFELAAKLKAGHVQFHI